MPNQVKEFLYGPYHAGPPLTKTASDVTQWAGRTTLSSGSASVTVSTTLINSDSVLTWGLEYNSTVTSGQALQVHVETISPQNFFTLKTDDGQAPSQDVTIMWKLWMASEV